MTRTRPPAPGNDSAADELAEAPAPRRRGALTAAVAPSLLRTMNQRVLLEQLYATGEATRPQLARVAGLSLPTVIAALADLEAVGLVRAVGRPEPGPGRPATLYQADPTAGAVVGVDIGHEWLHVMVTDLAGTVLSRIDRRNTRRSTRAIVDRVSQVVRDATDEARLDGAAVTHTVIGSPGVFDPARRRVLYATNLPGWQRIGLAEALSGSLGTSVTIDNDANLAALAEYSYGVAQGVQQFVYLTIGTGVGLGLVLDGEVYRGFTGSAGEVAYLPIGTGLTPPRPGQGRRGMLEESLAADAVVRHAEQAGMTGPLTAEQVFAAARTGDHQAVAAVATEAKYLAQLVASTCAFLDPELIVVGGGVGQNLDQLEAPMRAALALITPMQPRLAAGSLGRDAVVRGAVARGIELARESTFVARIEPAS